MKHRIIGIILLLFICTGCNISYSLNIGTSIEEHFSVSNLNKNVDLISMNEALFQGTLYDVREFEDNHIESTYTWKDFEEYTDFSLLFMKFIYDDCIVIKGDKVELNLQSNTELEDIIDVIGKIDNIEISLYIPYYVSNHNADKVEKNTYTWNITDFENEKVKITFDMSKPADFKNKIIEYCVIGIIVIAIICAIIYFVSKNKKVNKI